MRAIQLDGYDGFASLKQVEVEMPKPRANEVLIEVKAAGINFADLELTKGRYRVPKEPPFIMGFDAAGVVRETGSQVTTLHIGDKIAAIVSSGGYAEFAVADASTAIPIPNGLSFAQATSIPIQGLSSYALLKYAVRPRPNESILIQAAAGGVGLYLVQLARISSLRPVVALAGTEEKLEIVASLGVDAAINYTNHDWPEQVKNATNGKGGDIVLEAASGAIGEESFRLLAPFGRMVIFGARNIHDSLAPQKFQQLIYKNQAVIGFNFPSLSRDQVATCVPEVLDLIASGRVKLFAGHSFPLSDVRSAYEVFSNRQTIGKVVLIP